MGVRRRDNRGVIDDGELAGWHGVGLLARGLPIGAVMSAYDRLRKIARPFAI